MNRLREIFMMGCALLAFASQARADVELRLLPLIWHYQEKIGATPGFTAATPLSSSAGGGGWMLSGEYSLALSERWTFGARGSWMSSFRDVSESWNSMGMLQQNRMKVWQSQWGANLHLRLDEISPLLRAGVAATWQRDQQTRFRFYLNGRPLALAGSAVETIDTNWLDIFLQGDTPTHHFRMRLAAGIPWRESMRNSVLPGRAFHSQRQAWRVRLTMDYSLLRTDSGAETRILALYHYRRLGHDIQTTSLWPDNYWQIYGLGVQQTW